MGHYRWGILGTGVISREFAKGLKLLPNAEMYSVYNRTFKKAVDFSVEYGFQKTCKNIEDFLQDPDLDIIYIATPNHLHCEQAVKCMEAGKHVLIEKPIALNTSQLNKIIESARKNNRFCMEAMWSRFMPVYQHVKHLLQQDIIGEINFLGAEFGHPMPYDPDLFRYTLEKGGGSLMDLGVYPVSLTLMLLGTPQHVNGECRKAESGVDIFNRISLHYKNGVIADLRSSFDCQMSNGIWIGGTKGSIEILPPIYRPDKYRINKYTSFYGQQDSAHSFRNTVRNMPVVSTLISGLRDRVVNPIRNIKQTEKLKYVGNGYHYQAQEVMNVLDRGETESKIMTLEDSVEVLKITDQLRKNWEINFPGID